MLFHSLLAAAALLSAQGDSTENNETYRLSAYRLTPAVGAPALDGRLDDAVWAAADSIGSFTQLEPDEGKPARFPTSVRVAFDEQAVYVAVRAHDPEPAKIAAHLTRRDEDSPSDWITLGFDSRHDLRTAYLFAVNPAGVKKDVILTDGAGEDEGWDAVWEVAVQRDSGGWSAEFRIPLSVLRYAPDGDGVWGFQLQRRVPRANEESFWAPMKRDDSRIVARFGELHGMRGLPSPRRLELLPYTVSGLTRAPGESGNPFYSASDLRASAGVDVKYGLTSDLTLDATVNPDFGQVEADPSEVNLSQYETFLAEKRPFFTEGADIFRFGIQVGDGGGESLFYSRRVGRAPRGEADGEWVDQPRETTILGAAKLSGRVGRGWSVGVLGALTGEERARVIGEDGARSTPVVEPLTGYSVLRARRDLNGGRTQIGAVGTGVFRRLDGTGIGDVPGSAFSGGADVSHRWGNDAYHVTGYLLGSHVRGSSDAILALQESSARYFQRPDADHVQLDEDATSLSGWAGAYRLAKVKGAWQGGFIGNFRSPGFEVNDLGFMRDADQMVNVFYAGYNRFRPGKTFRHYNVYTNLWQANTFGWENAGRAINVNGYGQLKSYWGIFGGVEHAFESLSTGALRGGPVIVRPAATNGWIGFDSDGRKRLNGGANFDWRVESESGSWRWSVSGYLGWRPTPATRVSVSPFYTSNFNGWQFVARPRDLRVEDGERHYVFADLDQETFGLSARFNQTFSPTLSLQVYAQPFVSAGAYSDLREVADPRADSFDDRFRRFGASEIALDDGEYGVDLDGDGQHDDLRFDRPDFNYAAMNLNAVLRWEYRLGSTLFVAWSHSRDGSADFGDGRFRFRRDFEDLWSYRPTNVLLVKASWWVNL